MSRGVDTDESRIAVPRREPLDRPWSARYSWPRMDLSSGRSHWRSDWPLHDDVRDDCRSSALFEEPPLAQGGEVERAYRQLEQLRAGVVNSKTLP